MKRQSKNIWWISNPPKRNEETAKNFSVGLKALFNNCSMHCYSKLVEPDRTVRERFMWTVAHITAFCTLALLLDFSWEQYNEKPLTTNLHDPLFPAEWTPFPAVSICSNNRITRSAAVKYAEYLASLDPKKRGVTYFLDNIRKMSSLYDFDVSYIKDTSIFQRFLDKYDRHEGQLFYNTRERMKAMTPPCTQLLLKCITGGKIVPCLSPRMFRMSITHRGYCCLFNTNETESLISFANRRESSHQRFSGFDMGISILLNATTDDYFYQMFDFNGFIVHVYDSTKYDDVRSGVIAESFITGSSESFVRVLPQVMQSDDEIRRYPLSTRHCLFQDEYPEKYGSQYSLSNCITYCRIRNIANLCGCIPFYMPRSYLDSETKPPHCSLHHTSCLSKYKTKITNVLTSYADMTSFGTDWDNSIYCPECMPSCGYIRYKIGVVTLPLTRYRIKDTELMAGIKNMSQIALLHIFFPEPTSWSFKQSVTNPWYQILSNIGGICGIVTGFSLAALCEFAYFTLSQIYYSLRKSFKKDTPVQALIIYP